jgi:hypothetical protein
MSQSGEWSWKIADAGANARLHLRYEPGNWGDILKGHWAATLAQHIVTERGAGCRFRYLDPFAGAPVYPLATAARRRLEQLGPDDLFARVEEPHVKEDRLASTALVVADVAKQAGAVVELDVFDLDPERQRDWKQRVVGQVLEVSCGENALAQAATAAPPYDLILVDPYDFSSSWPQLLPLALELARRSTVLIYSYNKSPRGGGHRRAYDALRRNLAEGLRRQPETRALVGRLGADSVLPRSYHETLLLAAPARIEHSAMELEATTVMFAQRQAAHGAFERL